MIIPISPKTLITLVLYASIFSFQKYLFCTLFFVITRFIAIAKNRSIIVLYILYLCLRMYLHLKTDRRAKYVLLASIILLYISYSSEPSCDMLALRYTKFCTVSMFSLPSVRFSYIRLLLVWLSFFSMFIGNLTSLSFNSVKISFAVIILLVIIFMSSA